MFESTYFETIYLFEFIDLFLYIFFPTNITNLKISENQHKYILLRSYYLSNF